MTFRWTLLFSLVLVTSGCRPSTPGAPTAAELGVELDRQWQVYVEGARTEDPVVALSAWAEDMVLFSDPGGAEEIVGRESYAALMESAFPALSVVDLETTRRELLVLSPTAALETGRWSETYAFDATGDTATFFGAYSALWRLDPDGEWRILRFIRNRHDTAQ